MEQNLVDEVVLAPGAAETIAEHVQRRFGRKSKEELAAIAEQLKTTIDARVDRKLAESRTHVKKQAEELTEAVKAGLDDGSISEQEVLVEFFKQIKRDVEKQDQER